MTTHTCPRCKWNFEDDSEFDQQLAARVAMWTAKCEERGWPVLSGRVSESVAAELVGMRKKTLAGRRLQGNGPRATHLPVGGSQWSYELTELAAWFIAHHEGESWTNA